MHSLAFPLDLTSQLVPDRPSCPLCAQVLLHADSFWSKVWEELTIPTFVLRLLTPLKMSYEAAKKRAEPYTKIVGELPDMRKETVVLVKNAIARTGEPTCW